jgi:putative phage-type endonuclease
MRIVNGLVQGSDEWHQLRAKRRTASEAAAACGDHKYMTRNDLLKQKATGIVPDVDAHQQRIFDQGHRFEEMARSIAEEIMGEELYPCTCEDDTGTYLASMDGLDMLAERGWEHKSINEKLRTATAETLEEHYKWQMDHQMMVTGAEKILFMASNGTKADCNWFWYERDETRIERLIAAWEQFAADLSQYEAPEPEQPKAEGKAPDALPALHIQAKGEITASNLQDFEQHARRVIASIKTDLVTDQDFADAEQAVKFCKTAEQRLAAQKDAVLAQTASIDEVFRTIDSVSEDLRQTRLKLDRAVKAQKESRKAEIVMTANRALDDYIQALRDEHGIVMPVINVDFSGAIKGKKKLDAMQSAVDDELARAKIEANQAADLIRGNLAQINEHAAEYKFLFNDFGQICMKPAEDFAAIVKSRIAEHKEAEQKRLDEQREQIRREEEAKAKREAEQKAAAQVQTEAVADSAPTQKPQAVPSKRAPSTNEIVAVLCQHYGADRDTVIGWLSEIDVQEAA